MANKKAGSTNITLLLSVGRRCLGRGRARKPIDSGVSSSRPSETGVVTMVKTEIINDTPGVLCLKEGNAGVYRSIKNLAAKDRFVIEIDPNATYREYVVVSTPSDEKVFITSDDCIDNATITVVADSTTGVYKFNGKARGDATQAAATDAPAPGGFLSRLKKNLPWKK